MNVTINRHDSQNFLFSTGFLSWFRNGLLATGIGVIAFVQSDVGREAAYGRNPCLAQTNTLSLISDAVLKSHKPSGFRKIRRSMS